MKALSRGPETLTHAAASLYRRMSRHRRRHLVVIAFVMLIGAAAELVTIAAVLPFLAVISDPETTAQHPIIGGIRGFLGASGDADLIGLAAALLISAAIFASVVRLAILWMTQSFAVKFGHELGVEIYHRLLHQPYSYFLNRNTSDAIAGMEKVHGVIFSILIPMMQGAVAVVIAAFVIVFLFLIDPAAAFAASVSIGLIYVGVSVLSRRRLHSNSILIAKSQTARIKALQEGLGAIRDILLDQSQSVFEESFRRLDRRYRHAQAVNAFLSQAPRFVVEGAGIVIIALIALYMSWQPGGVMAAIPTLGALALGAQRLLPLLQQSYFGWTMAVGSIGNLTDVLELLDTPVSDHVLRDRNLPVEEFEGDLVLDRVTFQYDGGTFVLKDVNLQIPKGTRVGIMGETGSGKSTLIDLVMGLLEPTAGRILIGTTCLDQQSRANWQAQVSHVPQTIVLSDSSIADNIAFGEPPEMVDLDRVRKAARRAQLDTFIETLPEGYGTVVGERGVRLSGGQRQRIGIARALYKDVSVLVLDEATSALDERTERGIMRSIDALADDLTIFIIAHRLSTLAGCDLVVELERGRVKRVGSAETMIGGKVLLQHAR